MAILILMVLNSLFTLRTQAAMKAEIIALRHQVIVLQVQRPNNVVDDVIGKDTPLPTPKPRHTALKRNKLVE